MVTFFEKLYYNFNIIRCFDLIIKFIELSDINIHFIGGCSPIKFDSERIQRLVFYFVLAVLTIVLSFLGSKGSNDIFFENDKYYRAEKGWYYTDKSGNNIPIKIPKRIKSEGKEVSISYKLPKLNQEPFYLCTYTAEQNITAIVDGKVIYNYTGDSSRNIFKKVKGKKWNMIKLPKDASEKIITLKISSDYESSHQTVNEIFIGVQNSIVINITKTNMPSFLCSVVILISGVLLLLLNGLFKRFLEDSNANKYIGWFAILMSVWMITESRLLDFTLRDSVLVYAMGVFALLFAPVTILEFIKREKNYAYVKVANVLLVVIYINLIFNVIVQMFGLMNLNSVDNITLGVLPITGFVAFGTLILDIVKNKNKDVILTAVGFGSFSILGFIEFMTLYSTKNYAIGTFVKIGVLFIIITLIINLIKETIKVVDDSRKIDYYKEAASTDFMTGLKNRNTYIQEVNKGSIEKNMIVVVMDMNNLKTINDTYGHKVGDEAIRKLSSIIKEVFSRKATCYRIGGDEFVCLVKSKNKKNIEKSIHDFYKKCERENKKCPYEFGAAVGYALFDEEKDRHIKDTIHRADSAMYTTKRVLKEED